MFVVNCTNNGFNNLNSSQIVMACIDLTDSL